MSVPARLGAYLGLLVVVFGAGWALGALVGVGS